MSMRFARSIWMATAVAVLAIFAADSASKAQDLEFRAGAFAMDITPESFPVSSAGSMRPRSAVQAHDPLHARCLVLDDGTTKLAIATCDSCMIPREVFDRAKALIAASIDIPPENVICSATHTHTAVTATPTFQSTVQEPYLPFLSQRIADGVIEAHRRRQPARIGWAVGYNPRQVFNRRWHLRKGSEIPDPFDRGTDRVRMNPPAGHPQLIKPAGPIDAEIPIIALKNPRGQLIALWANYALHYVGGVPADSLSADYFGEFARSLDSMLEDRAAEDFVAAMTNGTSGDINNINFFESRKRQPPFEQIRIVAADVASSVVDTLDRCVFKDWVRLSAIQRELTLGVRRPDEAEIQRAEQLIDEAGEGPWSDRRLVYAGETLDLASYPETVDVILQAFAIGDLAIATTPCETFVETGLAIKRASPFRPTFVIELAGGYNGYLPTPEQHALGGYETWRAKSSYLEVDSEPKVRKALLEMLNELSRESAATP